MPPTVKTMVAREHSAKTRSNDPSNETSRLLGRVFTDEQVSVARRMTESHLPSTISDQQREATERMREQSGDRWIIDSACSPKGDIPRPTTATNEECQRCPVRTQCLLPAIQTTLKPGLEKLIDIQWSGNYGGTTSEVRAEIAAELIAMEES